MPTGPRWRAWPICLAPERAGSRADGAGREVPRRSATGGQAGPANTWTQPVVARILELTGADQIIPVWGTLQDAQTAD